MPGFDSEITSTEGNIFWSPWGGKAMSSQRVIIDSAVEDSGNTNHVTTLRPGNIIAIQNTTGGDSLGHLYDPDAENGLEMPAGILFEAVDMLNAAGTAVDTPVNLITRGLVKEDELLLSDAHAQAIFAANGLHYDTKPYSGAVVGYHMPHQQYHATDYTVLASENGTLFVGSTADCNFTLPTIAAGLVYEFLMTANFELVITGSNNIVTINDLSASTITYTVTTQQIGVHLRVRSIYTAASTLKWVVEALHNNAAIFVVGAIA